MKLLLGYISFLLILIIISPAQESNKRNLDETYQEFRDTYEEKIKEIDKVAYTVRKIFIPHRGSEIWDHEGYAIIERDLTDSIFGFSFYGVRSDIPNEYLYDKGLEFYIYPKERSYKMLPGHYGFIGIPGGQMIYPGIFALDSVYQSVNLQEKANAFVIQYRLEDNELMEVTNTIKTVILNKETYLPIKVSVSGDLMGNYTYNEYVFKDIKVNQDISRSVADYKAAIVDYERIPNKQTEYVSRVQEKFPISILTKLQSKEETVNLPIKDQWILLDFWEVWCGHCIKSFPEVSKLSSKFKPNLQVIGIMTEDTEKAIELVQRKEVNFLNLIGNKGLLKKLRVNEYPTYLLVDPSGIIRKEYLGFSDQIEQDIEELLGK
ncbi:MAG: TlpA disulfide reductase family protein [Bacteroidota bacterium]